MSILKYFKRTSSLPDPKGPLSEEVPTVSIAEANKEVKKVIDQPPKKRKGTTYIKVTPEVKAKIAKFAVENGNCAAARKYSKEVLSTLGFPRTKEK